MREARRRALEMLAAGRLTVAHAARVRDAGEPAGARLARGRPERAGTK